MGAVSAKQIGFWAGPAFGALFLWVGAPAELAGPAWLTAALLVWMAVWWATEAIPIPATSLLPLVVLPLIGAGTPAEAASGYASTIVLLLLGGFIIALGIERWDLHKRIALNVVARVGNRQKALVAGFMAATGILSMWISNTATTLMMVPITLSVAASLEAGEDRRFTLALLLGVCYAASIGGVATPIGTPTNLIALDALAEINGGEIGFYDWMTFGVPAMALLVPAAWWAVTRSLAPASDAAGAQRVVSGELRRLGAITAPEARVALVFAAVATFWIGRKFVQDAARAAGFEPPWLMGLTDMGIAMAGAVAMFVIPAGRSAKRALLTWEEAVKLPWGVLILFGGGISLGRAITRTGLSEWIGEQLGVLSVLPPLFFVAAVVVLVIFLTELTSNVATMTTLAPILGVLALAIGADPASLLAPAAVAASCAFMLPVATAPNAIIYASGEVSVAQMMRAGLRVNLIGVAIITAIGFWIAPAVLG
ncbi:MAG: SLC13 family permease [Pseudomonadota bacterium]